MAEEFLGVQRGGIDFSKNILKTHPELKLAKSSPRQRKKIITDYFEDLILKSAARWGR